MRAISFRWHAVAVLMLWVPSFFVYGVEFVAERRFEMQPDRVEAIVSIPLCLAPIVAAAYFALAFIDGVQNCKSAVGKASIALLHISFGLTNYAAWVLMYLWFYLELMRRDSF